jgi:hypothetical protein
MTQTGNNSESAKTTLDEATHDCLLRWMPINGSWFRQIQRWAEFGFYHTGQRKLLADASKDIGILSLLFRRYFESFGGQSTESDPIAGLNSLSKEQLRSILELPSDALMVHSLLESSPLQVSRLQHTQIASATSELAGEKFKIKEGQAALAATVRQLPLNLIAFNFPTIYTRATQLAGLGDGTLEENLNRFLGFYPWQLGARLFGQWGVEEDWWDAMDWREGASDGARGDGVQSAQTHSKSDSPLILACDLGESIAKLSEPEIFPETARSWFEISSKVENLLGSNGLERINQRITRELSQYKASIPNLPIIPINPEMSAERANSHHGTLLFERNEPLQHCPESLREIFQAAYKLMRYNQPSGEAVIVLASKAIPAMGFVKGCFFLYDKKQGALIPKLRIGDVSLDQFPVVKVASNAEKPISIGDAMTSATPVSGEHNPFDKDLPHITWRLGSSEKQGVLHLQFNSNVPPEQQSQFNQYFKAARQSLQDALNLKEG